MARSWSRYGRHRAPRDRGLVGPREGIDFFPLTVDYEERMYARGKIRRTSSSASRAPGWRAAILAMRLTPCGRIRSLLPKGYKNDVEVVLTVLPDQENDPLILAVNGASAALSGRSIPFNGSIGAVRVGRIDYEFVAEPDHQPDGEQRAGNCRGPVPAM